MYNQKIRTVLAKEHEKEMEALHAEEIRGCAETAEYIPYTASLTVTDLKNTQGRENVPSKTFITPLTSEEALFMNQVTGKTCILCFADDEEPCGNFLDGGTGQEDSLCHASFLHSIIKQGQITLGKTEDATPAVGCSMAVYISDVGFYIENRNKKCDVLLCPAPSAENTYKNSKTQKEDKKVLLSRICFIKKILDERNIDTAILGAFGCGWKGQRPETVAGIMQEVFKLTGIKQIIHAIPDETGRNFMAFKRVYNYDRHSAYDKVHTTQINLKLNNWTDRDILSFLESRENRQGYIKDLIRRDIERQRTENT